MTASAILAAHAAFVPAVAVTLWLSLLGAAGTVFLAAGALAWWQRGRVTVEPMPPVTPLRTRRPAPGELARLMAEVDALSLQAVSAGVAATDAEAAVTTARSRCRAAERDRERAWREYDTAHRAFVSVMRESPVGTPPPVPRPREAPEVAHAAIATYRYGGIPVDRLYRILGRSTGCSDVHDRREREVLLLRAAERDARRRYHAAAAAEHSAYRAVDVAIVAARAWADEAAEAAEEARLARAFAADCLLRARTGRLLGRPRRPGPRDASAPVLG